MEAEDGSTMNYTLKSVLLAAAVLAFVGCGGQESSYTDDMAGEHADDTSTPSAMAQEPTIPVRADTVTYGLIEGQELEGYMAEPTNPDQVAEQLGLPAGENLPAVIVIHEWWGLNDNIEVMARRLAGEGFRTLAVDLYGGEVAQAPDEARQLMQAAMDNPELAVAKLGAAHEYLADREFAPAVGVIGWCFGGTWSIRSAAAMPERLDAAVIYYGQVGDMTEEALAPLTMPVMGFFGAEDDGIPVESVNAFEETMLDLDKDVSIHIYENAGHAFANPTGDNFVESAATDSWEKTVAFFREHLYDGESGTSDS